MTINGESYSFERAPEVSFGNVGDVIEIEKKSGDSLFVHEAKLTVDGSSIDVEGISAAVNAQQNSTVTIGSADTGYLRLEGKNFGVYSRSGSTVTLDAGGKILLGTTIATTNNDVTAAMANGGTLVIGRSAEEISFIAETSASYQKKLAIGLKAIDGGSISVGSDTVNTVTIEATHKTKAVAINAEGSTSSPGSSVEVFGQNILATTSSEDAGFGIVSWHGADVSVGSASSSQVVFETTSTGTSIETNSRAIGLEAYSSQDDLSEVDILGQNIRFTSAANLGAVGVYAGTNADVSIGNDTTDQLRIEAVNTQVTDDSYAYAVWVDNQADWNKAAGQMNLSGKTVSIYAEGGTDTRAIHVASNDLDPVKRAILSVKADNIVIEAKSTNAENKSIGIAAMSAGDVALVGNTSITADQAILARGNATVMINKDTVNTTQITGDIVFNYDAETSGTGIDAVVDISLAGQNSFLSGRSQISGNPPEGKGDVENFTMRLSDGGTWRVTGDSFVNHLVLDEGVLSVVDTGATVDVLSTFSGNGSLSLAAQKTEDGTFTAAGFKVADNVTPTEGSSLDITYTGITADDVTDAEAAMRELGANTSVSNIEQTQTISEGDIAGSITQITDANGNSGQIVRTANTKLVDYSAVNAMALVQWRNEINHLTKRLGDIRASESEIGAWARVYGGSSEWGDNTEVSMDHTTIQVGGDYRLNSNWIVGAAFSYTDSDADLVNGQADGETYSLAAYATYLADNGSYLDMIARYGYLKNDIGVGNMELDTSNNAFSVSFEGGHQFRFMQERAYIEPQVELTYGFVAGDDSSASNDVRIEQDDYQNLITRVGMRTGFDFPEKAGTVYAMFSYSYDFLGDADGTASKGNLRQELNEDLGGGWISYGIGAQFRLGDNAFAYGELERTSGGDIDNPYLFNVGFRYNF